MSGSGTWMIVRPSAKKNKLNTIEPGVIVFTKEDQEGDVLPVLDLKQTVDRKTKKIVYSVNYKKTHTNIKAKEGPITQKV